MKVIPVAAADQIFFNSMEYITLSPEKLGLAPAKILVMKRSEIGVICAIAEVKIVEILISEAKIASVFIVGIVRTVVMTFAVIVTEKLLFAAIANIGS